MNTFKRLFRPKQILYMWFRKFLFILRACRSVSIHMPILISVKFRSRLHQTFHHHMTSDIKADMPSLERLLLLLSKNSCVLGLLTGLIHHVFLQYPSQKPLFFTLYTCLLENVVFMTLLVTGMDVSYFSLAEWILKVKAFFIFNLSMVFLSKLFSNKEQSSALFFKTIYNVYFRHRGIPTKFRYAASDWSFWKIVQFGQPYVFLSNLHAELGILPHYSDLTGRRGCAFST
jgi:hypothetical protein